MKKIFLTLMASVVMSILISLPAWAIIIGFQPASQNVTIGDSVMVDLVISGLGDYMPDSLGAFDLDVLFDPAVLAFTGYALGPYLGNLSLFEASDYSSGETSPGTLNIAETSWLWPDASTDPGGWGPPYLDNIQPSSFTLATITFDTLAVGSSSLTYSGPYLNGYQPVLSDAWGTQFNQVSITGGSVNVNPVPEPATCLLMGVGLAGLLGLRRKM